MSALPPPLLSLPMYNVLPELEAAHAVLLRALSAAIFANPVLKPLVASDGGDGDGGIGAGTVTDLDQQSTAMDLWDAPTLLLTQMCGLALHDRHADAAAAATASAAPPVRLATPIYSARGCTRGTYKAWVVVRDVDAADGSQARLADLAGARVAVNDLRSYSGCVGLRAAVALAETSSVAPILFFHPHPLVTGSHLRSLAALRGGSVDCASVDCVTWGLLEKHRPAELEGLRIVGATPLAPAPPLVTRGALAAEAGVAAALREVLFATLGDGCKDDAVLEARAALMIRGLLLDDGHDRAGGEEMEEEGAEEGAEEGTEMGRVLAFGRLRSLAARVPLDDTGGWWADDVATGEHYWCRLDASGYHCPVVCASPLAQRWFDRGMLLLWGFNMGEAASCFGRAFEEDGGCAMALWGASLAAGVNYNRPRLTRAEMRAAADHLRIARQIVRARGGAVEDGGASGGGASAWLEARLVDALQSRLLVSPAEGADAEEVEWEEDEDGLIEASVHDALDAAYERSMRAVHKEAQEAGLADASSAAGSGRILALEAAALFAEAIMTPRAWQLWPSKRADGGASGAGDAADAAPPSDAVIEARAALEAALAQPGGKRHPGVAHLYVHLMEAAPSELVGRAEVAVEALRSQWPAVGHLLHMASHIDMHRGSYRLAIRSGERAVHADAVDAAHSTSDKYYTTYKNHHEHQLCWAAMFAGRHAVAEAAACRIIHSTPRGIFDTYREFIEPLHALPWEVDIRFGRWDAILARPLPSDAAVMCVTIAVARYARGLARSALGHLAEAEREREAFEEAVEAVPSTRHIHNVPSRATLAIARCVLRGELSYRHRQHAEAFEALREAVVLDDGLPYDEPWGWKIPARHALGALLLERASELSDHGGAAGEEEAAALLAESERVYRADLARYPENLWALTGLGACLRARRKRQRLQEDELQDVSARLARAASVCDVKVCHSCFCAGRLA